MRGAHAVDVGLAVQMNRDSRSPEGMLETGSEQIEILLEGRPGRESQQAAEPAFPFHQFHMVARAGRR